MNGSFSIMSGFPPFVLSLSKNSETVYGSMLKFEQSLNVLSQYFALVLF